MSKYTTYFLAAISLLLLWIGSSGCSPIPNDGVPIYLQVDSPTVVIDDVSFGTSSQRIVDVWAETGNHNLGGYEMPVKIPVLAQGDVPFIISAGILDNGLVDARVQYPFYRPDTFTIGTAIPGHVYVHHPVYHYFARTHIALNENFEGGSSFTGLSRTNYSTDSAVYEGAHSGAILMGVNDTTNFATQLSPVTITTNGRQAYVELNYKSDVYFDVGIRETTGTGTSATITDIPVITLSPRSYWNKTYLNLSTAIGSYQGAGFQLYFISYKLPGTTGKLYLDNIKLLYFN